MARSSSVLDSNIGFQMRLAQLHFYAVFYEAFGGEGVTPAEFAILTYLKEQPGLRQGKLGNLLNIKRSNMTKVMRSLEARGLTKRVAPESDARAFEVHLTEVGEALRARLAREMTANDREAASALTVQEQDMLLALLQKFNALTRRSAREEESANG